MGGMSLSMGLSLSMKLQLKHRLTLTERMSLDLYLEMQDFLRALYDKAKKERYDKHGLEFEYAVISRKQLPKKMLEFGPGFAAIGYDDRDSPISQDGGSPMRFLVADYLEDFPEGYKELVVVHEYGESLSIGHKEASLLEWSVAKDEGTLKPYLEWIERNFPCKAADLEYNSRLYDVMPEEVWANAVEKAKSDPAAARVLELIKGFDFPPEAREVAERHGALASRVSTDIVVAGNKATYMLEAGTRDGVFLAAYLLHKVAVSAVRTGIDKDVCTNNHIEASWSNAISQAARRYDESRLPILKALSDAMISGKGEYHEQIESLGTPFGYYLPSRFSFALEAARILSQSYKADPDAGHKAVMKDRLAIAIKLASGKLRMFDNESGGEIIHQTVFHIKALIFEAVDAYVEAGYADDLRKGPQKAGFAKAVQKIASEFEERTCKRLFSSQEAQLWSSTAEILRMGGARLSWVPGLDAAEPKRFPVREQGADAKPRHRTPGFTSS